VDDLKKQVLSFGHGKAILMIEDSDARLELRRKIVENRLSVRQAEAEAQVLRMRAGSSTESPGQAGQSAAITADPVQQRLQTLSQELTRIWSAKVQFQGNRKKGKVTIHYSDSEQLERIVAAMQNSKSWENPRV
jgi:ParB family chromosome partitioning protein